MRWFNQKAKKFTYVLFYLFIYGYLIDYSFFFVFSTDLFLPFICINTKNNS